MKGPSAKKSKTSSEKKSKASSAFLNAAIKATDEKLAETIGEATVEILRVFGCKNKYWVPSTSIPNHDYMVHITPNGCSCDCLSQRNNKKCKHIIALMDKLTRSKHAV